MKWIDGHLDLAYVALCGRDVRQEMTNLTKGCLSLPALRQAGVELIFATIFTEPEVKDFKGHSNVDSPAKYTSIDEAEQAGLRQLELYKQIEHEGEISIVRNKDELIRSGAKPQAALLMEGADPIRSPEKVAWWYERGLRIVGMTWALGTRYAGGNGEQRGLTPEGIELIHAMDESGIIHDASHLSDASFDGLFEHAKCTIIATHSNCRALVEDDQRHLRDDQIRVIGDRGGVVGLNLYSPFLVNDRRATIEDCVRHIEHVCEVMGHRNGIALGSDTDGGFTPEKLPERLDHPTKLSSLAEALRDNGWSDSEIALFAHKNWERIIRC